MNGLLGGATQMPDPYARQPTTLPNNVSLQELIQFLLQRGLLGKMMVDPTRPVNPMSKQPELLQDTMQRRPNRIDQELDRQLGY